jgi:hypothetical protein
MMPYKCVHNEAHDAGSLASKSVIECVSHTHSINSESISDALLLCSCGLNILQTYKCKIFNLQDLYLTTESSSLILSVKEIIYSCSKHYAKFTSQVSTLLTISGVSTHF